MHKIILALALVGFAGLAQSQEALSRSETVNSTNAAGDAITTYTTYTTRFDHGQTRVDAYVDVHTDYAPVCSPMDWTWSKRASTSVSYTKVGEWTGRSDLEPVAPVAVAEVKNAPTRTAEVQSPVIVISQSNAAMHAASLAGAARVKAQAAAAQRKTQNTFVNGE